MNQTTEDRGNQSQQQSSDAHRDSETVSSFRFEILLISILNPESGSFIGSSGVWVKLKYAYGRYLARWLQRADVYSTEQAQRLQAQLQVTTAAMGDDFLSRRIKQKIKAFAKEISA